MLEFPRWKYVLVALVMFVAAVLALPNVCGQDPALQVERKDRAPMDDQARQTIEDLLRKQQIAIRRDYIDSGRLIIACNDVASQIKARDTVDATLADINRSALSNATRAPAWMRKLGLKAMPLGLDLRGGLYLLYQVDVNGAVSQLLDSYQQSFRRGLAEAKIPFTDVASFNSGAGPVTDGLRVTLPAGSDTSAVISALRKVDNSLNFRSSVGGEGPEVEMVLTPPQIKAREDYA